MTKLEDIVSLCKRRGFIFPGSDIYGGMAGTWDYGPLGVALKRKIMSSWWHYFVDNRDDIYGIDAAIIMNPRTWIASGHTATFSDPLVECKECHQTFVPTYLQVLFAPHINRTRYMKCPNCGKKSWQKKVVSKD